MGFPLSDVLTESGLVEEFQCKICHNLVEYTHCSYTSCSHIFCESCLDDWLAKSNDVGEEGLALFRSRYYLGWHFSLTLYLAAVTKHIQLMTASIGPCQYGPCMYPI
jgi:hypothetical protein